MTKRILVVLLVVGMCLCLIPAGKAYGYVKTNAVDVYVGYFGSTYAYVGTMTEDEMRDNCEYGEWIYSSIDNGLFTRYNLAEGVTVESLLHYLNIATSDIEEIYFLGTDNDYYAGFHNLFGTPHYYFPYLAENYNQTDPGASNVSLINSSRIEVPAILAFQQSLYRDSGAFDYDKYKAMMDDEECLRIVFGQTVWNEVSTSDSVKWVYKINVQLKGSPITAENMELEYGSSAALQYDVNSGFAELDELIRNGLNIWSDNPSIVSVDENGNLTGHQEGFANIHIEYKDGGETLESTVKVTVGPEPEEDSDYPGDTGSSKDERDPGTPPEENPENTETSGNTDQQDTQQQDSDQKNQDQKDSDQKEQDQKEQDQKEQDQKEQGQKDNNTTLSQDPGNDGGAGSGGNTNGAGGTGDNGVGSGTGGADTGSGSGGGLLSESQGGTEGDDIGGGNPLLDETGDSSVASMGENAEASAQTVDDEASEKPVSAKTVYLSLGNVAGGETAGGSVTGSGTTGGSGGKMLEIEELPIYYYVILIVVLAALFVGGGLYRSLRFRKEIAR